MVRALLCWNCGQSLDDVPRPISRHANCSNCYEVLYCCRLCIHFDPIKQGQCDHDRADPPVNKESANFCEYFKPSKNAFEPKSDGRKESAKSQLDALFGTSDEADQDTSMSAGPAIDEDLRAKFDDLFDD